MQICCRQAIAELGVLSAAKDRHERLVSYPGDELLRLRLRTASFALRDKASEILRSFRKT